MFGKKGDVYVAYYGPSGGQGAASSTVNEVKNFLTYSARWDINRYFAFDSDKDYYDVTQDASQSNFPWGNWELSAIQGHVVRNGMPTTVVFRSASGNVQVHDVKSSSDLAELPQKIEQVARMW